MGKKFEFSGLSDVYNEAIIRREPTLVFEVRNGRGRFLFMMFFDDEDHSTKDDLFLYLKNSKKIFKVKLYGSHTKGKFDVYLSKSEIQLLVNELEINNSDSSNPFNFDKFFTDLNENLPKTVSLTQKIINLRDSWKDVKDYLPSDVVEDYEKIILLHPVRLGPWSSPREKTLRKLYLLFDEDPRSVVELIDRLKKLKVTLAWTSDRSKKSMSVSSLLKEIQ